MDQQKFALPPLSYQLNSLEPTISEKTMKLHRSLFQGYANKLAAAESAQSKVSLTDQAAIRSIENDISYDGSSYLLHSLYFSLMTPNKQIADAGPLKETHKLIEDKFGSVDSFKTYFTNAALGILGPGWTILSYASAWDELEVVTTTRHQDNALWGATPLLVLDMWEHAYYIDYGTDKDAYVSGWWGLVDWEEVNMRLLMAEKGKILL